MFQKACVFYLFGCFMILQSALLKGWVMLFCKHHKGAVLKKGALVTHRQSGGGMSEKGIEFSDS